MITELDAMTVVAKQLPDEGITMREFVTRACKLRGDSKSVIEGFLILAEADGIMADDIVKIGPSGTRLQ
jgi:hypothetical protein